jgi:hypothetical protein
MEMQNATTHLSPPNVNHATVRSSKPSRTGEKKKKSRESDLPHSQPTSQISKSTLKMDEDAGDIHDPTKKKKKFGNSRSRQKKTLEYQ